MNLILIEADEIDASGEVRLAGARAAHLTSVLRAGLGQEVRVGVVNGAEGVATVQSASAGGVTLRCRLTRDVPPKPRVDVLLALPRPKVMRRLWAQLAALGVGRIILTNAERVERNYFDAHTLAEHVFRPLLIEGLQQARDTRLPEVSIHRQFKVLVEDVLDGLCGDALRLVADPSGTTTPRSAIGERMVSDDRVLLAVGPEGGWNHFELSLLERHGFVAIGMGRRTLRTDTASVALLALVHDALGSPGASAP